MAEVSVYNMQGEQTSTVAISDRLFAQKVHANLLHEVVTMYLSNQRAGTSSTKTRGEVSGGGSKPWKQKHTGRARAGSIRSPLWRHGGIIFGPKPRSYKYNLPNQKKRQALISALSSKLKDNDLIILDKLELAQPKTKLVDHLLKKLNVKTPTLLVINTFTEELKKASRNIETLQVVTAAGVNVYDILRSKTLIITKDALPGLEARI